MATTMMGKCLLTKVSDGDTAETTAVESSSVNMANYEGVIFFASYGTAAANNVLHAETSSDDSAFNDLASTSVGAGSSDEDQWLEISRPLEQYLRCVADRGTSTTCGGIWALQYGAKKMPVDNTTAGTIHGEHHDTPAEGTK